MKTPVKPNQSHQPRRLGHGFAKSNWQGSDHLRVKGVDFWIVYSHLDAIHYRGKRTSTLSAFGSSCGKLRAEL